MEVSCIIVQCSIIVCCESKHQMEVLSPSYSIRQQEITSYSGMLSIVVVLRNMDLVAIGS